MLCALGPCAVTAICHQKNKYLYFLPDALGNCDGDETRESEDEEGSSGGSNVALGQQSTAGRYQHYINIEQDLKEKEESIFVTQSCLQLV